MNLFDILGLYTDNADIAPKNCKTHLATGMIENLSILDCYLANEKGFATWQSIQTRPNFGRDFIISLIGLAEANKWLFVGVYKTIGQPKKVGENWQYNTHKLPDFLELEGRLVIDFQREVRQAYLKTENWCDQYLVDYAEIQELNDNLDPRLKNVEPVVVNEIVGYIQGIRHNEIQNRLITAVTKEHGRANVRVEFENIDVMVKLEDTIIIYEVKSSLSVKTCLREALGQILNYGWEQGLKEENIGKAIQYRIVGSEPPTEEDQEFIKFLKGTMEALDFEYISI